jgi:hypothetical protein
MTQNEITYFKLMPCSFLIIKKGQVFIPVLFYINNF